MNSKIIILEDSISNKIAAGEVVQRPVSVVKELVENSIDAGSKRIKIKLLNSGLDKIEIIDDGEGMSKEDLELCLIRHATSKILSEDDIYHIMTLGFRGEALASIASVSKLKIVSSTDGIKAYELIKNGNEKQKIVESSLNKGVHTTVANLFYNTPARYKHLSSNFYELSLVVNYVNKVALTNPKIAFEFYNNDSLLFQSLGDGEVKNIIHSIYKKEVAKNLLITNGNNEHFKVNFYLIKPQITRSRKTHMHISVNDRIIKNYAIENMIVKGYGKFLHTNQFPIVFLDIQTDYSLVDINIHPTKEQIKISLINELEKLIIDSISNSLNKIEYISKPEISSSDNNFSIPNKEHLSKTDNNNLDKMFFEKTISETNYSNKNNILEEFATSVKKDLIVDKDIEDSQIINLESKEEKEEQKIEQEKCSVNNSNKFTQETLFEQKNENDINENKLIKNSNFIGIHDRTYLLFENDEGIFFVDQHAAQERIRYEMLLKKFNRQDFKMQQMLVPIIFTFTDDEYLIVEQKLDEFDKMGLKFSNFGPNTIKLMEADVFFTKLKKPEDDIKNIISTVIENKKMSYEEIIDDVIIMMSCKSSIRANDYVNEYESKNLLKQLGECFEPYTCPHGRPIIVNLSKYQISKLFKRIF